MDIHSDFLDLWNRIQVQYRFRKKEKENRNSNFWNQFHQIWLHSGIDSDISSLDSLHERTRFPIPDLMRAIQQPSSPKFEFLKFSVGGSSIVAVSCTMTSGPYRQFSTNIHIIP